MRSTGRAWDAGQSIHRARGNQNARAAVNLAALMRSLGANLVVKMTDSRQGVRYSILVRKTHPSAVVMTELGPMARSKYVGVMDGSPAVQSNGDAVGVLASDNPVSRLV